ncbi:MAG: Rpn family recombination-promoting nuclease/putative transposase [Defluviitaleaceae bacterium]|nr:Rpn family recombination-promoting nuclease/putative transposase [Defluviitaleaceae bacterium]
MTKLKYKFTNDILCKILFVQHPSLLKRLVANLLKINLESITEFIITNPEMPPEIMGDKFCRLDINMIVDGQRVDLEIQVSDEGDYPERSLYYWAREYSTAIGEGEEYINLPRTIIISIVGFKIFDCVEFHSEFHALEVTRHTQLTDKFVMHYFELPKVPKTITKDDELRLWLSLFNSETDEELKEIEALEVPVMKQVISAYRSITADEKFKELERLRSRTRHNEASALGHARREATKVEREKWHGVVAEKDAQIAELLARLGENK